MLYKFTDAQGREELLSFGNEPMAKYYAVRNGLTFRGKYRDWSFIIIFSLFRCIIPSMWLFMGFLIWKFSA